MSGLQPTAAVVVSLEREAVLRVNVYVGVVSGNKKCVLCAPCVCQPQSTDMPGKVVARVQTSGSTRLGLRNDIGYVKTLI